MEAETNEVNIYELSCLNLTASLLSLHYYPCYRWGIARIHGKCQSWALNWDLTPKLCLIHMWASEDFFFYCWVLSSSTPGDTMGWAECSGGPVLTDLSYPSAQTFSRSLSPLFSPPIQSPVTGQIVNHFENIFVP